VLVNCAGGGTGGPTEELPTEEWDHIVDLCLKSAFLCSRTFFPDLREAGRPAAIVNFSSVLGVTFAPLSAAYCAAKAGVIAFTKVTAGEWARFGIRVNAVAPGYTETEGVAGSVAAGEFDPALVISRVPAGRFAQPDEIADAVSFLSSSEARFVTGHVLVVDGGFTSYGAAWPANGPPAPH
jgi:NAD(P)-dependent dehydrogenase (short-subunit alcohol dehydrogenase family)